ncbi:MAG: phosphoribosylglycinamide formyltransferase [Acidobacteriota bacterium]
MDLRLGFLASHGGSNFQAILDACREGRLRAEPRVLVSNNAKSGALQRAEREDLPAYKINDTTHDDPDSRDAAIAERLHEHDVNLVCLAGYMKKVGPPLLSAFPGRILNVHPSLLPRHGGPGCFGRRVHEAVLAAGDTTSGVSVHLVDEEYDRGDVLAQAEVPVLPGDDPDTLAARVLEQEHRLYPAVLQQIADGTLELPS